MFNLARKRERFIPKTQDEFVRFVDDEHKRRHEERRGFELQWRLNIAFIEGNQHLDINPVALTLEEMPKLYESQEREVFNHIAPIIETRYSRLSRLKPILRCRPSTNEQRDIHAAKVGSHLLKNITYEQGALKILNECYAWMESCGCVLTKNGWDPAKGQVLGNFTDVIMDGDQVSFKDQTVREGALDVTICPPQEIFPDSSYRQGIKQCKSILHAKAYHVDEVDEIWNVEVDPEEVNVLQLQKSMFGVSGLGYGLGNFMFANVKMKDFALVKELWMLPSKHFPEGLLVIICSKKVLHVGSLPYRIGDDGEVGLPFVKLDCIERPGVFWGKSVVERLIPLQRRYNALRNRKAEYLNRAAIGGLWVEDGSMDLADLEAHGNDPGYIGIVNRGYNYPRERVIPPLPDAFNTEEFGLLQEFNMLAGVSDLARQSKAPPGVKSGKAISLSLEQDDARQFSTALNVEHFLIDNGKQWLRLTRQFKRFPSVLRSIGEDNLVELIDWTGADLHSADDVVLDALSPMLESPIQRRQMVFDLLGAGLLIDPETGKVEKDMRSQIFEMLQLGNWEAADSDDQLQVSKAKRENLMLKQGQLPQPVPYDDHILHMQTHNKERLTAEYEAMIRSNPVLDFLFRNHVDQHLMMMAPMGLPGMQIQPPQGQVMPAQAPELAPPVL
ncbi:MAG: hypothetical protein PHI12_12170 [Dehalococcoidales bacterium]|nr:hypothetical protein [Dehalococcoidales bacterium]